MIKKFGLGRWYCTDCDVKPNPMFNNMKTIHWWAGVAPEKCSRCGKSSISAKGHDGDITRHQADYYVRDSSRPAFIGERRWFAICRQLELNGVAA